MRRFALLCTFVVAAVALTAGVALAAVVQCGSGDLCKGTPDNDRIYGTSGEDTVVGAFGDDVIVGFSSKDLLKGGPGGDRLQGAAGADTVKGGSDADMLNGGPGGDKVLSGNYDPTTGNTNDGARDVIDCGDGTDEVYYTPGQDTIKNCEVEFLTN